jgi:hypothetical protein
MTHQVTTPGSGGRRPAPTTPRTNCRGGPHGRWDRRHALFRYGGDATGRSTLLRPSLVATSVIVAVMLAFISLAVRFQFGRNMSADIVAATGAAVILGLVVSGMHMALHISVISVLIAVIALVASAAGRRWKLAFGLTQGLSRPPQDTRAGGRGCRTAAEGAHNGARMLQQGPGTVR